MKRKFTFTLSLSLSLSPSLSLSLSPLSLTYTYTYRFGPPLILRIWRDLTHSQFQSVVLKSMACYLRQGVRLADVCRSGVLFQCRVVDGLPGRCVLPTDTEDHPFYSPSVDK